MIRAIACAMLCGLFLVSCGTSKKLDSANARIAEQDKQLAAMTAKQAENEKLIADLQRANEINSRDAAQWRSIQEDIRKKKEKLDKELAARGTSVADIEARAEKAVEQLKAAGCTVAYKNGRYHITVPDEFTFKKGEAIVGPKGREALNVVAQVMYDNPGVVTTIVGNTDSDPIRGVADNWSLSTERANAVVRVLADVYNINPKRLIAAGRSKFNPVTNNDSPEGKARNRRIEIVINPRFDRLVDLIQED